MKVLIKKQLGKVLLEFEVEADKGFDALFNASVLASMPDVCGLCDSEDVELTGNRAKDYKFVKVRCTACTATAMLSEYKAGGYFWKEFEVYEKKESSTEASEGNDGSPPPEEGGF